MLSLRTNVWTQLRQWPVIGGSRLLLASDVSGLILQLDASNAGSLVVSNDDHVNGGKQVDSWTDTAGGNVMDAGIPEQRPGYALTGGLPGLQFEAFNAPVNDGVTDTISDLSVANALKALPLSIFMVCSRVGNGVFDRVLHLGDGSTTKSLTFSFTNSTNVMRLLVGTGASSTTVNLQAGQAAGSIYFASASTGVTGSTDGATPVTNAATPDLSTCDRLIIGNTPGGVAYRGVMREILAYSQAVSAGDRQLIEGYLAHKWSLTANLPSGHPYKADAPII